MRKKLIELMNFGAESSFLLKESDIQFLHGWTKESLSAKKDPKTIMFFPLQRNC